MNDNADERCSGEELITALVLRYDVPRRPIKALDREWMQKRCIHGREFKVLVDRLPGAPYNPISSEQVEEKFLSLPLLGEKRSRSAVQTMRNLQILPDVTGLAESLRIGSP